MFRYYTSIILILLVPSARGLEQSKSIQTEQYMCDTFWYMIRCGVMTTFKPTTSKPVVNLHTTTQTPAHRPTTTPVSSASTASTSTPKAPHTTSVQQSSTLKTNVHVHTTKKTTTTTHVTHPTTSTASATTTKMSTTKPTTAPPMVVPSCEKFCAVGAVAKDKPVPNGNAHGLCARSSPEAFAMTCCNMGDMATWKQGDHVMSVCSYLPHYIPVAKFSGGKIIPGTIGVFVSCLDSLEQGFMFIHQDCNKSPTITRVTDQGTNGLSHPEQYFVITV